MAIARLPKTTGLSRLMLVVACLIGSLVASIDSLAYTAAGDRIFVATGILPQIAPTDQFYTWAWTVPLTGEAPGHADRAPMPAPCSRRRHHRAPRHPFRGQAGSGSTGAPPVRLWLGKFRDRLKYSWQLTITPASFC